MRPQPARPGRRPRIGSNVRCCEPTKVGGGRRPRQPCAGPQARPSLLGCRTDCDRPDPELPAAAERVGAHSGGSSLCLALSAIGWFPVVDDQSEAQWAPRRRPGARRLRARLRLPPPLAGAGRRGGQPVLAASPAIASRRRPCWRRCRSRPGGGGGRSRWSARSASPRRSSSSPGSPAAGTSRSGSTLSINAIATAAMLAWGMYIGSRRELLWTLRHRAERAEAEQELRVAQARSQRAGADRPRDARRARPPDLPDLDARRRAGVPRGPDADEMRDSAGVIQEKAHEALTDLRGVLGVLRGADGEPALVPAADVRRPGDARRGGPCSRASASTIRRPAVRRRRRGAGRGRPDGLPDRPGGPDQRPQARAGHDAHRGAERLARTTASTWCCATRSASAARRRAPGWAWSA